MHFLSMLQTAFKENKAQELLTLLLTADERNAVGLRLQNCFTIIG